MRKYNILHSEALRIAERASGGDEDFVTAYKLIEKYDYALKEALEYSKKLEKAIIIKELDVCGLT